MLKRVAFQLVLIGMTRELDLDHFVALQGAPNGSARNKIEKAMSPLNLPLAHVAIKRGQMSSSVEEKTKNCFTMKSILILAQKVEERAAMAKNEMKTLQRQIEHVTDVMRLRESMSLCESKD